MNNGELLNARRSLSYFEIIGEIKAAETIAVGSKIRELARLRKHYGVGRWRKRKGLAKVRLLDGTIRPRKYIGMRLPAWAGRNSRSSDCWTRNNETSI